MKGMFDKNLVGKRWNHGKRKWNSGFL